MRAIFKLSLICLWLALMMLLITPFWLLRYELARRRLAQATFIGINRIINLHCKLIGTLSPHRPLLLISNHSSYVDILLLGAALPIAFTPKKEIAGWPVIGFCCRLAGCVFIERTPKAISRTREQLAARLQKGRVMCIFAEGTTNDGTHLKPFKSSFFSLAELEGLRVQPLAIQYHFRDHQPLDNKGRGEIAWYDDMALLPHLWRLLNFRRIDASITLLPLLEKADRKTLCVQSETAIRAALEKADD